MPSIPVSTLLNADAHESAHMTIAAVEREIVEGLTLLETRRVLPRKNCLSIEELLNPAMENELMIGSEEDIIKEVQEKHSIEIDGGDGDKEEDNVNVEKPGCREALAACQTLQQFVADIDEPFARKLKALLSRFGHQTWLEEIQSLQPSKITDFFSYT